MLGGPVLGGPVPPGMTVHTGRAVLLGVALLAFVAALGFALMAFSGMLSWVWPVAALLVAVATGGLLRYLAISGAKKPAASRRESSSAPAVEQAEATAVSLKQPVLTRRLIPAASRGHAPLPPV